ncbi:tetratricopeptide repeat protein [Elongatibacter sediminis]|uniref:RING-type E3 ubiquitin transferase n=1 Tax=Elongatibacter sediminis TaxID=3119006 RepID=A0AAW9RBP5_9GAMM
MDIAKRHTGKYTSLILAGFLLTAAATAVAQEDRKTKQTVAMSQQTYEKLTEVQELVEAKDYAGAENLLREMRGNERLSDYERAQIWNLTGYSYYLQERYSDAINAYEQVLRQPELPEALQLATLKTMAQLQFTVENYEAALSTVRRLMAAVPEPSADVYMLEGQALFQMNRYQEALKPIKTAVDMYRDQGQVPKENWLLLLRVIYFEMKDYDNMLAVVKELVQNYPKDSYILTLAGVYSELGDTKKQLALTEVLYEKGLLNTNSHITNLANLYLLHELPYKAAQVLDKGIKADIVEPNERNLRLLSQAWYTAREDAKAIPPLRRAAQLSEDGELYLRLTQSHINLKEWKDAAASARKAIQLGGLKRPDQAQIMLGMALFNQQQLDQARRAFEAASRDNRSARVAEQWINYVDSELKRKELMDQDVEYKERERDALLDALPQE